MKKTLLISFIALMFITWGCDSTRSPSEEESIEMSIVLNPGVDTIQVGTVHTDAGAVAYADDRPLAITVISSPIDTTQKGVHKITYQATYLNQTVRITRYVYVVSDHQGITLSLNPGVDTVKVNTSWQDAGIEAYDHEGNSLAYTVEGTVDTSRIGVYEIVYYVEDTIGNVQTLTRYVYVID